MSQITIRTIPAMVEDAIRRLSSEKQISLSKASMLLIQQALGIDPDRAKKRDLSGVFGSWGQADFDEFQHNTSQFDAIDTEIWK